MDARRALVASLCLLAALLTAGSARAFVSNTTAADLELAPPPEQDLYLDRAADIAADPAAQAYDDLLASELGPGWFVVSWNQFAGTPRIVEGAGVALAAGGLAGASELEVEAIGRGFIALHPALFRTGGDNLRLFKIAHGAGRWGVVFQQVESGVPVEKGFVVLALHDNGRLFAFGSNVYGDIDVSLSPAVEPAVARALARSSVPYDPTLDLESAPDALLIVPVHVAPGAVRYRLVRRTDVATSRPIGLWRTYVDAHSGEIVYRTNAVHFAYTGSSHGDVEIMSYCDGDTPDTPTAHMYVSIPGVGTAITDENGDFSLSGGSGSHNYTAQFSGVDFNVNCSGCGGDALINGTIDPDIPEIIYWDAGTYRADERDTYYFANFTKDYIQTIDPAWNISRYTATVNIDDICNAYWSGTTINFFRAGGGCANTGTIGSVIAHEFGHGIQDNLLGGSQGQQGLGEGNGDITATFITDNPIMGVGFNNCNGGLSGRTCDNELIYPDNVIGQEIHAAGRVICGFNWDVRMNLEATMGAAGAKAYTANLWHFSRKLFGTPNMTQPNQAEWYRVIDDDDGNMVNGTPNWDAICAAADKHGFTCPPNPNRISITHTPLVDREDPSGPYVVQADVEAFVAGVPDTPDEVEVDYSLNGGAFTPLPMSNVGGVTYEASIPTQPAGTAIAYYLRAAHNGMGLEVFDPPDAPAVFYEFALGIFTTAVNEEMEADNGYTVGAPGDDATDGLWEREDPNSVSFPGLIFQPEDDHTPAPGTDCWITGNPPPGSTPFVERLNGRTSFTSPIYDLAGAHLLQGSFWAFTYLSVPNTDDHLDLNISTDGGGTWTNIVHVVASSSPDWAEQSFRLSPHDFDFTSQVQFRFVAEDVQPLSFVDVLVDDFLVEGLFSGTTGAGEAAGAAPLSLRLGRAAPNPFNPSTRIDYSLPARAPVELAIFDVQGRRVRSLVAAVQEAGTHAARWDGRDGAGAQVASGIYYARLRVGDWSDTRPLVLLK